MTARAGEYGFAAAFAALGAAVLAGAGSIPRPSAVSGIGPQVFPYIVGAVLLVSGLGVLASINRGHAGAAEAGEDIDAEESVHWSVIIRLVLLVAAFGLLIGPTGWPVAATVLFVGAAWTLGAPRSWPSVLIGVVMAMTVQLVFGSALGLSLPPGPLLEWTGIG